MGGGAQTGAIVPYNPSANQPVQTAGYRAKIGNTEVMFASEADFLKADKAFREQVEVQNVPSLGGLGSSGGTKSWLRTGANAAEAVAGFLQGRNIRRKLEDLQDYLDDAKAAANELDQLANNTKYAELIPVLQRRCVRNGMRQRVRSRCSKTSSPPLIFRLARAWPKWSASCGMVPGALWE